VPATFDLAQSAENIILAIREWIRGSTIITILARGVNKSERRSRVDSLKCVLSAHNMIAAQMDAASGEIKKRPRTLNVSKCESKRHLSIVVTWNDCFLASVFVAAEREENNGVVGEMSGFGLLKFILYSFREVLCGYTKVTAIIITIITLFRRGFSLSSLSFLCV